MEFLEMKVKLSGIRNSLDKIDSSVFISEEKISKSKDRGGGKLSKGNIERSKSKKYKQSFSDLRSEIKQSREDPE